MSRRVLVFELFLVAAALAAASLAYPHLPQRIATHWGIQLQADRFSDRSIIFWLGPGLMSAVMLLTRFGPWLSPKQYSVSSFSRTWQLLMLLVFCLITGVFGVVLWSALGHAFDVGRVTTGLLCLFFIVFGNLLSKVRPNFFLGIRTPWTLASERVWIATHRFAAWAVVLSGIGGLMLVCIGRPQWSVLPFVSAVLFSAVYSLLLYKRVAASDEQPFAR